MESKKIKILAIDDIKDNLISLRGLILESFPDAAIFSALNGEKGLELAASEDPDVILLDILMPGMDGFEVCRKLKADRQLCNIPVIFITAMKDDRENRICALKCGGEAFLTKPIDESELTAQIRAMLKIKTAANEKLDENIRLGAMVEHQTRELKEAYSTALKLNENLQKENEARKKSEEALLKSELELKQSSREYQKLSDELQTILTAIPDVITFLTLDLRVLWSNKPSGSPLNNNEIDVVGEYCYRTRHDRSEPCEDCPAMRSLLTGETAEKTMTLSNGSIWELRSLAIKEDEKVVKLVAIGRDISEHRKLEAQFQHAQKMESVGRLAGVVAHDFNNMLSVILGYAEISINGMDKTLPIYSSLIEISRAAQRSADLTRQLLIFARKQAVSPRVLDLNETIAGMLTMLRRLIGENIKLTWQPGINLWSVLIDASQIDQIMANLCVNAKDAITNVGNISIYTENCTVSERYSKIYTYAVPGDYVKIVVNDDGSGIDAETLEHIFEPFFTTKNPGEGTGLGLATVYGIARQNNGFINVSSNPAEGTTFAIYLPRHGSKAEPDRQEVTTELLKNGHETVLLVEDETQILEMTELIMTEMGYTVLKASGPVEALRIARKHSGEIDLLVTDVIMPGMNGRELADALLQLYPNIKCLFMSGYTADIISAHGVLEKGVHFIQKPFRMNGLATKLRATLDAS